MIEKWELAHFPFEKDALRFKARVRGTEEDLKGLISKLPGECGNPFVTLSQDYDWAFYLYKLDAVKRLKTGLKNRTRATWAISSPMKRVTPNPWQLLKPRRSKQMRTLKKKLSQ